MSDETNRAAKEEATNCSDGDLCDGPIARLRIRIHYSDSLSREALLDGAYPRETGTQKVCVHDEVQCSAFRHNLNIPGIINLQMTT